MHGPADPITADEVASWFLRAPKPSNGDCKSLADHLDRIRRIHRGELVPWRFGEPPNLINDLDEDTWWDIAETAKATQILRHSLPKMRAFFGRVEGLQHIEGELSALQDALEKSIESISWPLGRYAAATGRKTPKEWHLPAVAIAWAVHDLLLKRGLSPSYSRDSMATRLIANALIRVGCAPSTLAATTVSAHLLRFFAKAGEPQ